MELFSLVRQFDETGISGTGKVLEGVIFSDGRVVIRWCTLNGIANSTGFFDSFEDFEKIHIKSHPKNNSELIYEQI
jgi:hypothetical protein